MKSFTISVVVLACVGGVLGSDMRIDFPLFMRAPAPAAASAAAGTATNLQTFTGALGGIAADPITQTGNAKTPFAVDGDTFTDFATAATRSCNNQHNSCAQAANNSGDKSLTVGQCDTQQTTCEAAAASAAPAVSSTTTSSAEPTLKSADADFFYFCDP